VLSLPSLNLPHHYCCPFLACWFPDLLHKCRALEISMNLAARIESKDAHQCACLRFPFKCCQIHPYKTCSFPCVSSTQPCRPLKTCIFLTRPLIQTTQAISIPRTLAIRHIRVLESLSARIPFRMTMRVRFPNKIAARLRRTFPVIISSRQTTKSTIAGPQPESRSLIHTPAFSLRQGRPNAERFGIMRLKKHYLVLTSCMSISTQ
jgi:hypothetical protein